MLQMLLTLPGIDGLHGLVSTGQTLPENKARIEDQALRKQGQIVPNAK